jgi:SCAMP family
MRVPFHVHHNLNLCGLIPPVFPLIFHSIKDEIPETSRPLITRLFQLWLVLLGTLVVNMVWLSAHLSLHDDGLKFTGAAGRLHYFVD